jgi:hypothetical protein
MRGLIKGLDFLMARDDPRRRRFGLNVPAAENDSAPGRSSR